MTRIKTGGLLLAIISGFLIACGNDSFLMPLQGESSETEIRSVVDGWVMLPGDGIPVKILADNLEKGKDLVLRVEVFTLAGDSIWKKEIADPTLNEPLPPLMIPDLPTGQYRVELLLVSAGEEVKKSSAVFFFSEQVIRISGIKSFPAAITTSSPVLLKAELENQDNLDLYLRWTWRGKSIGKGFLSEGFGQILWTAPGEEGVYSVTLEVFPKKPAGDQTASLRSSLSMSTDIYVSTAKEKPPYELGPESSYYALFHLQANLKDEGTAGTKPDAEDVSLIGNAELVPTDYGFGYQLYDGTGILIPWLALPMDGGVLSPFTLSMGFTVESAAEGVILFSATTTDKSVSFVVSIDPDTLSPKVAVAAAGSPEFVVTSNAPLLHDQRHMISISFVPLKDSSGKDSGYSIQWFLDGEQTNAVASAKPLPKIKDGGKVVIGGEGGVAGTIDEIGVFSRNTEGQPSTDPGLFARYAAEKYGASLILAEGFDGNTIPKGFSVSGRGSISMGVIALPQNSGLALPPLAVGEKGIKAHFDVSPLSHSVKLSVLWDGVETPIFDGSISVQGGTVEFSLQGETLTLQAADGKKEVKATAPEEKTGLLVEIANPKEAQAVLNVHQLIVTEAEE